MSRAAQQAFKTQVANSGALQSQATGLVNQQAAEANAIPADLTPEQRQAILQARLSGIDVSNENAQAKAARFSARTGAIAGIPALEAQQERQAGEDKSNAAAQLQEYFANVPIQRAQERARILQGATQPVTSMYGSSNNLAGDLSQQAFKPGLLSQILAGAAQSFMGGQGGFLGTAGKNAAIAI